MMPGSGSEFTVTYTEEMEYLEYYKEVYEQNTIGERMPYRFGTYAIYQADKANQVYQFNTYINIT